MKAKHTFIALGMLLGFAASSTAMASLPSKQQPLKPRIIVLTDVSTWETDDSESLVRLFSYADLFEIEGIVFTTGWSLSSIRDDFFQLIHNPLNAYEKDLPNLMKRSAQQGFLKDEEKQRIGYWPSTEYLRSRVVYGSRNRGMKFIGEGNDSDGSRLIIEQADKKDKRPLWVLLWGGGNTVAQAVWRVKQERSEADLQKFLKKICIYAITDQDRDQKTPYEDSSHLWLRKEFAGQLMFLWDESAWLYQNGTGRSNWQEYEENIQTHGNLGKEYPKYKYGVEGDTPSFLYVMPNGLHDTQKPTQGSWGGYFEWGQGPDKQTYSYTNHQGKAQQTSRKYEAYFYPAIFNDFAARMDWADKGEGNRNPVINIKGTRTLEIAEYKVKVGEEFCPDATATYDPDGNQLNFKWWILPEAGTYQQTVNIEQPNQARPTLHIPTDAAGHTLHLICEVTDNGTPSLTSYRRLILHVEK